MPTTKLIDGHYYIYRSFFAFGARPLTNHAGERVETVYTFAQLLWSLYREHGETDYWAVALDGTQPTFRHDEYADYKATREAMPDDLKSQLPWIERLFDAFRIPVLLVEGFEADDLIATAACQQADLGREVQIYSKDKDLEQVLSDHIKMRHETTQKDLYGPEQLLSKRSIRPEQVVNFQALVGDSTDNIPGVPGIGPKTAVKILEALDQVGESRLEYLLDHSPDGLSPKILAKVRDHADQMLLSRTLVTLATDAPINVDDFSFQKPDWGALKRLFMELSFRKLTAEIDQQFSQPDLFSTAPAEELPEVETIASSEELTEARDRLVEAGRFAWLALPTEPDPIVSGLAGIALASLADDAPGDPFYVDLSDSTNRGARCEILAALFANPEVGKVGHHLKQEILLLSNEGMDVDGFADDTMVSAYLLQPTSGRYELEILTSEHFGYRAPDLPPAGAADPARLAGARLRAVCELAALFRRELVEKKLEKVHDEIEIPLVPCLAEIEKLGLTVDRSRLEELEAEFSKSVANLEEEIYLAAGEPFNIGSTKQLQEILFEKLELPVIKKTKTGYSTSAEVLEELASRQPDQPLPHLILEYRSLTKLLNTYVQALPKLIHAKTGRLHTDLRQTVAATGRLSSIRPNLQNIPIRSEEGRRIRRAFVPRSEDALFVSADYSQIELRLLAHFSGDERLIAAMNAGDDIHREVAATINQKKPEEVTREERSAAKAVNFGVIYGMGAFGLARDLRIPRSEAQAFIDAFFENFPGVKAFIESTIQQAHESLEVRTIYNRYRPLPEMRSRLTRDRKQAERYAVNTVIQGSAADLIKKAMIDVRVDIRNRASETKMVLQIHDELLFEIPKSRVRPESARLKKVMEEVLDLRVPLKVNISQGEDWYDASK